MTFRLNVRDDMMTYKLTWQNWCWL